jgi:hypothetical protein
VHAGVAILLLVTIIVTWRRRAVARIDSTMQAFGIRIYVKCSYGVRYGVRAQSWHACCSLARHKLNS